MRRSSYFSLRRFSGRIFWAFVGLAALTMAASIGAFLLLNLAAGQGQQQLVRQLQYSDAKALQQIAIQQRTGLELLTRFKVTNALDFVIQTTASSSNSITQMASDFQSDPEAAAQFEKVAAIYRSVGMRFGAAKITNINPQQEQALYDQTKADFDRLVQETGQLVQNRQQAANTAQATSRSVIDNTRLIYIAVAFFLIVIAVVFAFLLVRLFSRALARLTERLDHVAEGNLTEQMEPRGPDEIVELSLIFNRTVANLKLALARIQDQTGAIDHTSQRIKDLSTDQALNLSQQAIAVSQVSTTIAELSDTSQNIANSAALVADSAASALSSATDGFDTMLGANATMQEIRAKVNLIADRILALNAVAQRIREITLLIDTLSNETHLLALNAAIESAGAGEEGERFAVVAGHVRTLAQRSRIAAVEIQQLVSQIQQATANSVMATEEGVKVVALGEKMVNDSLLAHENIITQIGQTSQLAQAISQATDQQRVASTQVAQTMQQLSQLSGSVNAHSEQYMVSVSELGEIVNQLSAVVNAFQVQDDLTKENEAKENEAEETEQYDEPYKIPENYPVETRRNSTIIVS